MSRMNQVMQIGNIGGDIHYYIEDYAYTYLKKQKGKEKTKYFLYGEKEEDGNPVKVYIYGIAEKPKMEQTYFKDYYPLGFLKIKNDDIMWITLNGQEQKVNGFYVFYAPNQAMQEYLVDHREEETPQKEEKNAKRQLSGEVLPIKETLVPAKIMKNSQNKEIRGEKFLFPIGGIVIASLLLLVLTTANGKQKIEIFKQVIAENVVGIVEEPSEEDFIIEEKSITAEQLQEEISIKDDSGIVDDLITETVEQKEEIVTEENKKEEVVANGQMSFDNKNEETAKENLQQSQFEENNYEEYIVKNGDTLVAICKAKYGSLNKMEEICVLNNIKNADYIAPGQKLYLP